MTQRSTPTSTQPTTLSLARRKRRLYEGENYRIVLRFKDGSQRRATVEGPVVLSQRLREYADLIFPNRSTVEELSVLRIKPVERVTLS